jgi:hypothetical protein
VTHPIKYLIFGLVRDTFFVHNVNVALCAFEAHKTIGSWVWSIHPFFQSIFGCTAANHGYPKMALCSPRSDRKNRSLIVVVPVLVSRSV